MKVYEYLAAGLPVVATPLPALAGVEGSLAAADAQAMAAALDRELAGDAPRAAGGALACRVTLSWDTRLEEIDAALPSP